MTGRKRPGEPREPLKLVGSPWSTHGYLSGAQRSLEALTQLGTICGYCADKKRVPCPGCGGFAGCITCHKTTEVPCAGCAGGDLEKFRP